jgi:hypothetical protein
MRDRREALQRTEAYVESVRRGATTDTADVITRIDPAKTRTKTLTDKEKGSGP